MVFEVIGAVAALLSPVWKFPDKVPALDASAVEIAAAYGPQIRPQDIRGGTANRVLVDNGTSAAWLGAPASSGQYLGWNGSALGWYTPSAGGSVTSVGLSLPADFSVSGSPVTSSGTLSASWVSQSANLVFAGPSSGSAAAPSWRSLVAGDLPSFGTLAGSQSANLVYAGPGSGSAATPSFRALVTGDLPSLGTQAGSQSAHLVFSGPSSGSAAAPTFRSLVAGDLGSGTGSSSNFLRGDLTWASPTAGAGGSSTQVQFNSSGSLSGDAGMTYGGVGGSTLLSVSPTGTSATGVKVTSPASFTGNYFQGIDSNGNTDFTVLNNGTGSTQAWILSRSTGASISPGVVLGTNGYQVVGSWVGQISFGDFSGGTYSPTAQIYAPAAEAHGASAFGTSIFFRNTAKGTTTGVNRVAFDSQGNVLTNASGSAVSTSATDGFLYAPNMAGVPTGAPTSYTGASPFVYDSTDSVLYGYNGSAWVDVSNGTVTSDLAALSMATTTKVVKYSATLANGNLTLCSNANYAGRTVTIIYAHGATKTCTIAAGSGDTLYNAGSAGSITLGPSGTFVHYVNITSLGDSNWYVTGGG